MKKLDFSMITPQKTVYKIRLEYPPSINHYWRSDRGVTHISTEGKEYRKMTALYLNTKNVKPLDGDIVITLKVFRPAKRGDLDNSFKVPLDVLKGYAYFDDKQIVEIHGYRYDDKDNPRIEVTIEG